MLDARDPAHYLKALKTTTVPKRLMWLDCAAMSMRDMGMYVARWQKGALGTTHYTSRKCERVDTMHTYEKPQQLWEVASEWCPVNRRTVLWAYDLAYQLRVSQALVHLPRFGWHLDKIVLERTAAWCLLRKGKRTLMMCDLKSWAPVELGRLASDIAGTDLSGIELDAGPQYMEQACITRASFIRDAVLQILAWIEAEGLGPFRPTGSGQSYSAFRRKYLTTQILVHDDVERLQLERAAMWTGRCEAWKHGKLAAGPYVEYDMQAAYCQIASEVDVPTIALGVIPNPTSARVFKHMQLHACMAEIEVTTHTPCVPTRHGGRTIWPVGTFRTVLWQPELQLAIAHADAWKVTRLWIYQRAPALKQFASFVLDGLAGHLSPLPPIPRRVLKHWSRCLVGRLGLRYRTWEHFGYQDPPDLRLVTFLDIDEGTSTDMLIAGTDRLLLTDMQESAESLPQIPGYVMSECRARLWHAMLIAGLDHVMYVDTDSLIVDNTGMTNLLGDPHVPPPLHWATKGVYTRLTINGPRNLVCESSRRISGVPKTARQVAPLEFSGQVMRSIKESMRAGQLDCVAQIPRNFVMDAPDLRRHHLPGHDTAPIEVHITNLQEDEQ